MLSNKPVDEISQNFGSKRPVIVVYGDPIDFSEFGDADLRLFRNQVKAGRKVLSEVAKLGNIERETRRCLMQPSPTIRCR